MYFTEKKGQRLAVFDHLISAKTGQQIEFPVSSPEQEASMIRAAEMGQRGLKGILDRRDPEAALLLKNSQTG